MANTHMQSNLELGSMVEVLSKNQNARYGLIRWLGFVSNSDKKIAGLELVSCALLIPHLLPLQTAQFKKG
jgi:hypothetical protein